ncbi:pilus assembly protein PilM [Microaerobacter geothermalis]|uniref:type IV pilus biogenesis protein PilM n=1 Tax=Microaerobacter geothermalis TaxID=674972 RepID=UPI001F39B5DF|nr:pilus assembly protein PilM [Microaerobacter geothermalis]MCF6092700.1 pilus assembly protein PilM [Microaerobacter geothermalis]
MGLFNKFPSFLGLEFKDDMVKIIELVHQKKGYQLRKAVYSPLSNGLIQNGHIHDMDGLRKMIKPLIKGEKFKSKKAVLALKSEQIMLRTLKLPKLPKKELEKVILLELENNIQLPFSDPVFDYISLPHQNSEGTEQELLLVIAPGSVVRQYVQLSKLLGLKPICVDVHSLAILRLMKWIRKELPTTFMSVNVGHHGVDVSIYHQGILRLTRNISLSSSDYLIKSPAITDAFSAIHYLENSDGLKSYAQDLGHEIERVMNFYLFTLNNRDQNLDEIVLCGEAPNISLLGEYLSTRLQVPVQVEDWTGYIENQTDMDIKDMSVFSVPIGLGMKEVSR